jgi:hypothetical protein
MIEETPLMKTPDFTKESGNYHSCYVCSRELARLDEKAIVRLHGSHRERLMNGDILVHSYVISLCWWCHKNVTSKA